ncbi:MAG: DivIVA domain-containing protein [Clostridia bacterium]|nr:DivIVA domain-containing protein [Clostridia bacterium]
MSEKYNFTVEKKGYNTEQVDNTLDDLRAKNTYLKSRVSELEQKLDAARRLIRRFSEAENGLRQNIADSKRAAAEMMMDTKARSDTLLDKTRESCGEMISDLDMKIADRMNTVDVIRAEVASFKDQLFALYSSHIDMIESIAATAENFVYEPDYSKVAEAVDEFEEAEEPQVELPQFDEYPQESIFKDFEAEESKEFVFSEESVTGENSDSAEKEAELHFNADGIAEELSKEAAGEDDPEENPFEASSVFSDAFTAEAEDAAEAVAEPELSEEPETEVRDENTEDADKAQQDSVAEDDYYKFLADFINEDDGTMSDPEQ